MAGGNGDRLIFFGGINCIINVLIYKGGEIIGSQKNLLNRFDFIISNDETTLGVVEVKNLKNLTAEEAKGLINNWLVHSPVTNTQYFILLSQERGFLWDLSHDSFHDVVQDPTLSFPMEQVVDRYFKKEGPSPRLRGTELEIIIFHWLNTLVNQSEEVTLIEEPEAALAQSGFIPAIKGATVSWEIQG